ncbi:hypothetical protein PENTCL1PPCAC_14272, partial [Pristionchus entomophagus]
AVSSLLVFTSLLISITAQTCLTTSEIGPCQSGACPVAGATCITSTGSCCAAGGVITTTTTCVDLLNPSTGVSDCSARAYLCNNSVYYSLMTTQCPRTCGRCSTTTVTTTTTCVDLLNPSTGVSDCPSRAYLCNNSVYYSLMTTQCPRTCGRTCTGKK